MPIGLIILLIVIGTVLFLVAQNMQARRIRALEDSIADARQAIDRLGGQIYNLTGKDDATRQALTDASERFNAATSQISQAASPAQAQFAKQTALEGMYYIRAARTALGLDPGPHDF